MLYDLSQAPPERGSLLESVFLVLSKRRMEAEVLRTRVLVEATLAPHLEGKTKLPELFNDYVETMFPFFKGQKGATEKLMREALKQWTSKGNLRVKRMPSTQSYQKFKSSIERTKKKVQEWEKLEKSGRLRHIK